MSLHDKRVAILVDEQYQELEVWYPYYRLLEAGVQVELVGPEAARSYPSKLGYPCTTTLSAEAARGERFDAVIVPGGWAPDFMRRDERMIALVQHLAGQPATALAAICHGGWMLCCTDALRGKRATSFVAIKHDLINAGAEWVDEACVVDGRLITSRTPDDLPAFLQAILASLSS